MKSIATGRTFEHRNPSKIGSAEARGMRRKQKMRELNTYLLGDKVQGPGWGQQKRRKAPPGRTFERLEVA